MTNQINDSAITTTRNDHIEQNPTFSSFPNEILSNILEHLSYNDLGSFSLVSRQIYVISSQIYSDNVFWKHTFYQTFPQSSNIPEGTDFRLRCIVHSNLSQGICKVITHSSQDHGKFIGICQDKIITAVSEKEIHILDANEMKIVDQIQLVHIDSSDIQCYGFYNEMLVVGSSMGLLEIRDKKNSQIITHRIVAPIKPTKCLVTDPDHERIISGHANGDIIVWNLEGLIKTLSISGHPITALALDRNRIIVGHLWGEILIFDLTTDACICRTQHQGLMTSVAVKGNQVFSVGPDSSIKIWDLETLALKETIAEMPAINTNENNAFYLPSQRFTYLVIFWDGRLITQSYQASPPVTEIKIWDVKTKESIVLTHGKGRGRIVADSAKGLLYYICDDKTNLQICDFTNPKPQPVIVSPPDDDYSRKLPCQIM